MHAVSHVPQGADSDADGLVLVVEGRVVDAGCGIVDAIGGGGHGGWWQRRAGRSRGPSFYGKGKFSREILSDCPHAPVYSASLSATTCFPR